MSETPRDNDAEAPRLDNQYWIDRWAKEDTTWRNKERAVLPFASNAARLKKVVSDLSDDEQAEGDDLRAFFNGSTVFVPLCGDSPVLPFWAKEMGCNVIGVDIAAVSIERAASEFFADRGEAKRTELTSPASLTRLDLPPVKEGEGHVTLYIGDALAMMGEPEQFLAGVDIVYDRGSFVAMDPAMRETYAARMQNIMVVRDGEAALAGTPAWARAAATRTSRAWFLNSVERTIVEDGSHLRAGPPFMIVGDYMFSKFAAADGANTRFVVPCGEESREAMAEGKVPFCEVYYVTIARRSN